MKLTAALIACCALLGARWSPPPRDWLALQSRYFERAGGFLGAHVTGRFASRRTCEASLWPAGYVTVVSGARVTTYYARAECVREMGR